MSEWVLFEAISAPFCVHGSHLVGPRGVILTSSPWSVSGFGVADKTTIVLRSPWCVSDYWPLTWLHLGQNSGLPWATKMRQLRETGDERESSNIASWFFFLFYKKINLMSNSFENSPLLCVCFLVKIEVSEDCRFLLNFMSNFSKLGNQVLLIFPWVN